MACRTTRTIDGESAIWICGDTFAGSAVCRECGDLADTLCDYPLGNDKTCDSALCKWHSVSMRGDLDYCTEHATEYGKLIYLIRMEQHGSGI